MVSNLFKSKINIEKYGDLVYKEATSTLKKVKHDFNEEDVYVFGIYTSNELTYLCPTFNTIKGLNLLAESYSNSESNQMSSGELFIHLKWSFPADWHYHSTYDCYDNISEIGYLFRDEIDKYLNSHPESDLAQKNTNKVFDKFKFSILDAIKRLRIDSKDSNILFNLFIGDQDDVERLEFAKYINTTIIYLKYKSELEEADRIWKKYHK